MNGAAREAQRLYLDTEFADKKGRVKLISIALVRDNGDEFYAVSSAFKDRECNDWVKRNVLPKLPPMAQRKTPAQIAKAMRAFIGKTPPVVWTWYGAYDWVLFSWAMGGSMIDLPEGYPMAPLDLKQSLYERNLPESVLPATPRDEHNALVDARWLRDACVGVLRHEDLRHGVVS